MEKSPVPAVPTENIFRFTYKDGPAPMTGYVRAVGEELAYRIACKWCELQGFRNPAKVFPFIVADASILNEK